MCIHWFQTTNEVGMFNCLDRFQISKAVTRFECCQVQCPEGISWLVWGDNFTVNHVDWCQPSFEINMAYIQWKHACKCVPVHLTLRKYWWNVQVSVYQLISLWKIRDDVIKWKHFPRYWPFVRGTQRSPMDSPHKGQCRSVPDKQLSKQSRTNLRRHRAHYHTIAILSGNFNNLFLSYSSLLVAEVSFVKVPSYDCNWMRSQRWFM